MEKPSKPKRKQPDIGWSPTSGASAQEARRARIKRVDTSRKPDSVIPDSVLVVVDIAQGVGETVSSLVEDAGIQKVAEVAADVAVTVAIEAPRKLIEGISDAIS